jgi:hypothetical protein
MKAQRRGVRGREGVEFLRDLTNLAEDATIPPEGRTILRCLVDVIQSAMAGEDVTLFVGASKKGDKPSWNIRLAGENNFIPCDDLQSMASKLWDWLEEHA